MRILSAWVLITDHDAECAEPIDCQEVECVNINHFSRSKMQKG